MKRLFAVIVALILPALTILGGCSLMNFLSGKFDTSYMSADRYSVGDAVIEDGSKLKTIHLKWVAGSVTILTHEENSIEIKETATKEVGERETLHYLYEELSDGGVLWVQFCASGAGDFGDLKKDVTVVIPRVDGLYCGVTIDKADFSIDLSDYENQMEKFTMTNNSGNVTARIDGADVFQLSGCGDASADCVFDIVANDIDSFGCNASYAKIVANVKTIGTAESCGSVFKDFELFANSIRRLDVGIGARGKQKITVLKFNSISIKNRENDLTLILSPDAEFSLTVSGQKSASKLEIGFDNEEKGGGKYIVGGGSKTVRLENESDIYILSYQAE